MARFVVGVSGATGVILALKTVHHLSDLGHEIEFVITQNGLYTAGYELGKEYVTLNKFASKLPKGVRIHPNQDIGSAIASGSYPTDGMLIIPCSMATVAGVATGLADNALKRAADVTIKEKRPLIIVPREAPLSQLHLENLLKLSQLGVTIIPPMPAWYTKPQTLEDVENFIVGKVLDALRINHQLYKRWKGA